MEASADAIKIKVSPQWSYHNTIHGKRALVIGRGGSRDKLNVPIGVREKTGVTLPIEEKGKSDRTSRNGVITGSCHDSSTKGAGVAKRDDGREWGN